MRGTLLLVLGLLVAPAWAAAEQAHGSASSKEAVSSAAPTPDGICTSTAWCYDGTTVTCSGNSVCQAGVDANCPTTRGYATCDGVKYYCSAACPAVCNWGPTCTSSKQCLSYCGGTPGVCSNGCCYCY